MVRIRAIITYNSEVSLAKLKGQLSCSCHWTNWQHPIQLWLPRLQPPLYLSSRTPLCPGSSYLSGCSFSVYFCCLPLDTNLLMLACEEAQSLVLFPCLTADFLGEAIQCHDFKYHPYADDCQWLQLRSYLQTPVAMTSFQLSECLVDTWRLQVAPEGKRGNGELSFGHRLSSLLACSHGTLAVTLSIDGYFFLQLLRPFRYLSYSLFFSF